MTSPLSRALSPVLLAASAALAPAQRLNLQPLVTIPSRPTAIAATPQVQHQFYVAVKAGRVYVVRGTSVLGTPALDLTGVVDQVGENGLLGLALHPDFPADPRAFLCYTRASAFGDTVVSEFRLAAGTLDAFDPQSERMLVGPIVQTTNGHKAGDIEFGPDGMLYVALGDGDAGSANQSGAAQDLSLPLGKILRLDVDAPAPHAPPDNPFVQTPGADPRVWAYGLRNPFRIGIDPVTGAVFIADVGASTYEEVSRVAAAEAGANLGWPCREGIWCGGHTACTCTSPSLHDPILALSHASGSCAVIGGDVLRGSDIPRLEGAYVFADFCTSALYLVEDPYGAATAIDVAPEFDPAQQGSARFLSELAQGPGGELLLANHYSGQLYRVRAQPGFQEYCTAATNSSGGPATLHGAGSPSIAAADVRLVVDGLPPAAFGYFLAARERGFVPGFGGLQGIGCLGTPIHRWSLRLQQASAAGTVTLTTDLTDLPWGAPPAVGETWNFQYWTRDANPTPTANLSTALAVTFAP